MIRCLHANNWLLLCVGYRWLFAIILHSVWWWDVFVLTGWFCVYNKIFVCLLYLSFCSLIIIVRCMWFNFSYLCMIIRSLCVNCICLCLMIRCLYVSYLYLCIMIIYLCFHCLCLCIMIRCLCVSNYFICVSVYNKEMFKC